MSAGEVQLELPDGTRMSVPSGTTSREVAQRIGAGLGKAALAGELDGALVDLRAPLRAGGRFRVITVRHPEGGQVIRHSAEHVMADAGKRLLPASQFCRGPS